MGNSPIGKSRVHYICVDCSGRIEHVEKWARSVVRKRLLAFRGNLNVLDAELDFLVGNEQREGQRHPNEKSTPPRRRALVEQ